MSRKLRAAASKLDVSARMSCHEACIQLEDSTDEAKEAHKTRVLCLYMRDEALRKRSTSMQYDAHLSPAELVLCRQVCNSD